MRNLIASRREQRSIGPDANLGVVSKGISVLPEDAVIIKNR
jgi:hypothetical protein